MKIVISTIPAGIRYYLPVWLILLAAVSGFAQHAGPVPLEKAFDFWLGKWEVSWEGADGDTVFGVNHVTKILDGKVIMEKFEDPSTGFKGSSLSVIDRKDSIWKQTWVDNGGGHFAFRGIVNDTVRSFQTGEQTLSGRTVMWRMVFKDIRQNALTWDWELSDDEGRSWKLQWRIFYRRME